MSPDPVRAGAGLIAALALASSSLIGGIPTMAHAESSKRERHTIQDLGWLAGGWVTAVENGRVVDEHWTAPAGGAMLGMSRTVTGGSLSEFEYLRIIERGGGLVYLAQPGGRAPATEFRMTSLTKGAATGSDLPEIRALFENPSHDFPKRILYVRRADGSVVATVDGGEGARAITFAYRPAGGAAASSGP